MPNILSSARVAIEALMAQVWPQCAGLFRVHDAERMNWRYFVAIQEAGQVNGLEPPWAVMQPESALPDDNGLANDAYLLTVNCWYIAGLRGPAGTAKSSTEVHEEVEAALRALQQTALANNSGGFDIFESSLDMSTSNPANKYFMNVNAPFFGGMLSLRLRIGDT